MSLSVTSVFERILMGIMSPLRVSGFAGYRNTRAKGQLGYIALPTVAPQSSSTRATGNFNPSTLTRRSRIKPPSVHRRMLKNLAQFSHNQKYRLGTQQTGKPASLRRTRRSGDTCSSNKRRKPLVRSLASRLQSGFAHRIGIPFLDRWKTSLTTASFAGEELEALPISGECNSEAIYESCLAPTIGQSNCFEQLFNSACKRAMTKRQRPWHNPLASPLSSSFWGCERAFHLGRRGKLQRPSALSMQEGAPNVAIVSPRR